MLGIQATLLRQFMGELPHSMGIILFPESVTAHGPCRQSQAESITSHRCGLLLVTQELRCSQLSRPWWNTPGFEVQHGQGDRCSEPLPGALG